MPSRKSAPARRRQAPSKTATRSAAARKAAAGKIAAGVAKAKGGAKRLFPLPWPPKATNYVTVYLFGASSDGPFVASVEPERLVVRRGEPVYWTLVKSFRDDKGEQGRARVDIRFNGPTPLDTERPSFARSTETKIRRDAKRGRYQYTVFVNGEPLFDPEVDIEH